MKRLFIFIITAINCIFVYGQSGSINLTLDDFNDLTRTGPTRNFEILPETNCIYYYYHSGSGTMLETTVKIYPDSLIWDHESQRWGNYHLRDKREIKREDFVSLINSLTGIEFEAAEKDNFNCGGSRTEIRFSIDNDCYCHAKNDDIFSNGKLYNIEGPVLKFIINNQTECQLLFKEFKKTRRGDPTRYWYFTSLPHEFEKYRVEEDRYIKTLQHPQFHPIEFDGYAPSRLSHMPKKRS